MESYLWLIFLVLGVLILNQLSNIARNLQGLQSMEAMMKRLLAHQGIEWGTKVEPSARVKELAMNTKTYVDAIKAYREQTGLGLRDAKAVIDGLRVQPPNPTFQRTATPPLK